jgi:alkylated DNA repair dioxygenase AlkB
MPNQLALFAQPATVPAIADSDTPPVIHLSNFLTLAEADSLFEFCKGLAWVQNEFKIYGRALKIPRQEYMEGIPDAYYRYSGGVELRSRDWSSELRAIRDRINLVTAFNFDIVIGNWYANGMQHIGWHSDDDKNLGQLPAIASLSLGASRKFQVRRKGKGTKIHNYQLAHGSMLIMLPGMQDTWRHRLPQIQSLTSERINLTFRPYSNAS